MGSSSLVWWEVSLCMAGHWTQMSLKSISTKCFYDSMKLSPRSKMLQQVHLLPTTAAFPTETQHMLCSFQHSSFHCSLFEEKQIGDLVPSTGRAIGRFPDELREFLSSTKVSDRGALLHSCLTARLLRARLADPRFLLETGIPSQALAASLQLLQQFWGKFVPLVPAPICAHLQVWQIFCRWPLGRQKRCLESVSVIPLSTHIFYFKVFYQH